MGLIELMYIAERDETFAITCAGSYTCMVPDPWKWNFKQHCQKVVYMILSLVETLLEESYMICKRASYIFGDAA